MSSTIVIDPRFHGPAGSGNGGYVAGLLAGHLGGPARVRLSAPPPLATALAVDVDAERARLFDGVTLVATAQRAEVALTTPEAPTPGQSAEAAARFAGLTQHRFPRCFVCGPHREPGDGLRIFAGPVEGREMVAAPWTPHASLAGAGGKTAPEFVWAALDCPGAFAVWPEDPAATMVLGELAVRVHTLPAVGEPTVVAGWPVAVEGRKRRAGTALYGADGTVLAVGEATWIVVPDNRFAPE